jgi:methyl-accepting chemotaxis protein
MVNRQKSSMKEVNTMSEKQKEILGKLCDAVQKLPETAQENLVAFAEGAAFMHSAQSKEETEGSDA